MTSAQESAVLSLVAGGTRPRLAIWIALRSLAPAISEEQSSWAYLNGWGATIARGYVIAWSRATSYSPRHLKAYHLDGMELARVARELEKKRRAR